jgi:hypothetical protein
MFIQKYQSALLCVNNCYCGCTSTSMQSPCFSLGRYFAPLSQLQFLSRIGNI